MASCKNDFLGTLSHSFFFFLYRANTSPRQIFGTGSKSICFWEDLLVTVTSKLGEHELLQIKNVNVGAVVADIYV